eukprot:jgi/Phyca11/102032/e_gw1.6.1026.1
MKLGVHCPRRTRRHPPPPCPPLRGCFENAEIPRGLRLCLDGRHLQEATWIAPNGTPGTCLYRCNSLSRRSHSGLVNIDTSSIIRRSSGAKWLLLIACFKRMGKFARVRLPIRLVQNASAASITRRLPVPPASPRKSSSWSSVKRASKLSLKKGSHYYDIAHHRALGARSVGAAKLR